MPNQIESLRVKGFRSLADVEINGMPRAAVLIGANGSGKSNLVRFFEMIGWMIGAWTSSFSVAEALMTNCLGEPGPVRGWKLNWPYEPNLGGTIIDLRSVTRIRIVSFSWRKRFDSHAMDSVRMHLGSPSEVGIRRRRSSKQRSRLNPLTSIKRRPECLSICCGNALCISFTILRTTLR